jgi:hypothetical protein
MNALILALVATALSAEAGSKVVEMGTRVTGNQEQPRVLYIVPWQAPDGSDALYQDISSRIDNLLEPLDPDSFRRELDLRQQFEQLNLNQANP